MKKIIPFLFLIPFILSCDIQYNGEIRLQFKGKVVNEFNEPLQNQSIKILAIKEIDNGKTNMIGIGNTDSNGNYSILIPEANDLDYYDVEINQDLHQTSQLTYTKFTKIRNSNFVNYSLQLPTAKLYLKANLSNLNLTFSSSSSTKELKTVEFIGEVANENVYINDEIVFHEYLKKVKKNQTIEVIYKIFDYTNQTISTYSSFVIIDNSDAIYHTITY